MTEARHCLWPSITSCTLLIRVNAINRCVINPFTLRSRWLNSKFKILQFAVIWRQTALLKSFIWMVAHKGFVHRCKACLKVGRVGQKMAHSSWEILTQEIGLTPKVWLHSSVGGILHRYRGGHGFESFEALVFFRLLSNCLNWKIYCDDHSSLSSTTAVHIWIISYILHTISLLSGDMNSTTWPRSQSFASYCSSVGRASPWYRGDHGFKSCWSPDLFQASSFQLLKLENLLRWSLFTFKISQAG